MGVEVRTGFASGDLELIVGGLVTPRGKAKVKANEAPNAISFASVEQKLFQSMAAQIRMMSGQPLAVAPQGRANPHGPIPEQIRQLAELHAAGILTDAEFSAKKAELLSRM